ncbi:PREDICTED: PRUPE_2G229300 [Prunus dulcis]|uniref:PREDICTED: PRUPE_2G229300 n=1 Tax=Prunus dulcis TaxID=3755 RepID=A0A5E4FQX8_PRUDU|nr:hypothetical protein L3X38_025788 [Prunus dulcis]VVA29886.1 PREDICTED: PRUPE_2G229300 [Prunus dulcis]
MEVNRGNHDEGEQRNYQRRPQRRSVETIEWTLEHHKQFVDTMIRLELDDLRIRTARRTILIVELMNNEALRLFPRSTLLTHISNFQRFQKISARGFQKTSAHSALMRDFERLNINKKKEEEEKEDDMSFSWKLEHHKKFVEAVIQLELGQVKVTPRGILKLMDEKHRRGLTARAVAKHLWGLKVLQKKTQISHVQTQYYAKLEEARGMKEITHTLSNVNISLVTRPNANISQVK